MNVCKNPTNFNRWSVRDYPIDHFISYTQTVFSEMRKRGYNCNSQKFLKWFKTTNYVDYDEIFYNWHNGKYILQCYYNLQEKYDCGGITREEWNKIVVLINKKNGEIRL